MISIKKDRKKDIVRFKFVDVSLKRFRVRFIYVREKSQDICRY